MIRNAFVSLVAWSLFALPASAATIVTIEVGPAPPGPPPLPSFAPPWLPKPPGPNPGLEVTPSAFTDEVSWFQVENTTDRTWWDFHFRWLFVKEDVKIYQDKVAEDNLLASCKKKAICGIKIDAPGIKTGESFTVKLPNLGANDKLYVWGTVPETATWAMMIVGFGLVGVVARRRRVLAA